MDLRTALQRREIYEWLGGFAKIAVYGIPRHTDDFVGFAVEYEVPTGSMIGTCISTSNCPIDDHD